MCLSYTYSWSGTVTAQLGPGRREGEQRFLCLLPLKQTPYWSFLQGLLFAVLEAGEPSLCQLPSFPPSSFSIRLLGSEKEQTGEHCSISISSRTEIWEFPIFLFATGSLGHSLLPLSWHL